MKRLILLRHAKSGWINPDLEDFDRPLNKRGKRGAKLLGKWLRDSGYRPEQILCSTARRARETWEGLALDGEPDMQDGLYHAPAETLFEALKSAHGETVMLIGHNPGIAEFAHQLVASPPDHPRFADFPTGSLLVADFPAAEWSGVEPGSGQVVAFLTPQDLVDSPA